MIILQESSSDVARDHIYDDGNGNLYYGSNLGALQLKGGKTGRTDYTTASAGLLHGSGTSASPHATTNSGNFLSYYVSSTAESATVRGEYIRLYISGAGTSGESLRAFTTVNNIASSTAHGAHLSLNFGTTGSITGLGVASRNTLHVPGAMSGGTYAATQSEIYSDGASSDLAGVTEQSFHRFVNDGNSTGKAKVDATGNLFSIQGVTVGSGKLFQINTAAAASHALRILINNTPYYIMLTNAGA